MGGLDRQLLGCLALIATLSVSLPSALADAPNNTHAIFESLDGPFFIGGITATGNEASFVLDSPGLQFAAGLSHLELEIVRVRMEIESSAVGDIALSPEYQNSTHVLDDAALTFVGGGAPLVYGHLYGPQEVEFRSSRPWAPLGAMARPDFSYGMNSSLPFFFADRGVTNPLRIAEGGTRADLTGSGVLFLTEGTIQLSTAKGDRIVENLGYSREATGGITPAGPIRQTDSYSFARIRIVDASLEVVDATSIDIHLDAVRWDGSLEARNATGVVRTGAFQHILNAEDVTFLGTGLYSIRPTEEHPARFEIEGSLHTIDFGGVRGSVTPYATERTLLSALASMVLLLSPFGRQLLGNFFAICYTRLGPKNVARGKRLAILQQLDRTPGIHARALQRALGCGWGEIHYHISVLQRTGHIRVKQDGNRKRYFPADAPPYATVSETPSAATLAVYDLIPLRGWITLRELVSRTGSSRQRLTYHLELLERTGFVSGRSGRPRAFRRSQGADGEASVEAARAVENHATHGIPETLAEPPTS